jgi:hypothetical protein
MRASFYIQLVGIVALAGITGSRAQAQEASAPTTDQVQTQAQDQTQAQIQAGPADDVDAAADELVGKGSLAANDAGAFKTTVRERLQKRDGTGRRGVCTDADRAQCQARLRQHVRDCDGEGRKQGGIRNAQDSARVAAALMVAAGNAEGIDEAGTMIRAQLGNKWQATDVEGAAQDMAGLASQKRWHNEARQMLRDCLGDGSCSGEQARATLRVMRQASRRADLDARQVRREIRLALKDELAREGRGQGGAAMGGKGMAGQGSGDGLQARLQKRLRLHAQDEDCVPGTGTGEQKRHRYRRGMDGEGRQGGGYGGGQSGGAGSGWGGGGGGGSGGGGGGPHGSGGN